MRILKYKLFEGNAASITGAYTKIIDTQDIYVVQLQIKSTLDGDVLFSLDGTTDADRCPKPATGVPLIYNWMFGEEEMLLRTSNAFNLYVKDGAAAATAGTLSVTIGYLA